MENIQKYVASGTTVKRLNHLLTASVNVIRCWDENKDPRVLGYANDLRDAIKAWELENE